MLERGETERGGFFERVLSRAKNALERATMVVPKNISVSHECVGGENGEAGEVGKFPELTGANHAWWVGKIPKKKSERRDCIYSREFIEASLEVLFENLGKGERAQICMAPCFSRYFNGADDSRTGFSNDEAKAFIRKVVEKRFPNSRDDLDVFCVEKMPLHEDLFSELERAFDSEKGVVDVEQVFEAEDEDLNKGEFDISQRPTSFNIAMFLYKISKENEALFQFFRHAVPGQMRPDFDAEPSSRDYYALVEISVRLAEILNGRYIHGGADRQRKYDGFIGDIVDRANPKKGKFFKNKTIFSGLEPLIELFKGKKFETLHFDTKKNPYKVKADRGIARTRIAIAGVLAAAAVIVPKFGFDAAAEYRKKANVRGNSVVMLKFLDDAVDGKCLDYDQCKWGMRGGTALKNIINEALLQVSVRYGLSDDQIFEIQSVFFAFMLANRDSLGGLGDDNSKLIALVDKFMHDPMAMAKLWDIGVKCDEFYSKLKPYEAELARMAKGGKAQRQAKGTKSSLLQCGEVNERVRAVYCQCVELEDLGVFSASKISPERYQVSVCKGGQKGDVLVAKLEYGVYGDFVEDGRSLWERVRSWYYISRMDRGVEYSSSLVEEKVAKAYVDTRRKAMLAVIPDRFKDFIYKACDPQNYSDPRFFDTKVPRLLPSLHPA